MTSVEHTVEAMRGPVKLLVFDMGHVFVKFDWERVCQGFCERARFSGQGFKQVLTELGKLGYERGQCNTEQFLRKINELLNSNISLEEFSILWNATFEEDVEMAELLQSLGKRYPIYLLSNTNENHYEFLQGRFNVERHFSKHILSYKVGLVKPDPEIYHLVTQMSALEAGQCLFVDDLSDNLRAAQSVGLKTIQFIGIEDLKLRLVEHGVNW